MRFSNLHIGQSLDLHLWTSVDVSSQRPIRNRVRIDFGTQPMTSPSVQLIACDHRRLYCKVRARLRRQARDRPLRAFRQLVASLVEGQNVHARFCAVRRLNLLVNILPDFDG
jgi:hypothetical protein